MTRLSHSKHLLFYVVIIGSVLILFQIVSAYGEAHLKAPPNLNGRYLSASAPPGCPEGDRLVLTLQQSGIYVNGFLALESANAAQQPQSIEATSEEKPSLTGLWKPEQLNLSGEAEALAVCAAGGLPSGKRLAIALQGQVAAAAFTGQLTYGSQAGDEKVGSEKANSSQPWQFTAQRQAPMQKKSGH